MARPPLHSALGLAAADGLSAGHVVGCPSKPTLSSSRQHDMHDSMVSLAAAGSLPSARRAAAAAFLCIAEEKPCPEVSFTKAVEMNMRIGDAEAHLECCHAITRAQKAARKAEALIDGNWYLRYCSAGPLPFEPIVALVARWLKNWEKEDDSDAQSVTERSADDEPRNI
eukprot:gnl/TRDRNA2_/TRDRNA2_192014_c0_seq1.p1 gnl/TRDRNA2_/TRDRNA2_192014_c0~~gnl/TRDRNA2_/TRDRNA2_192014_c0_seq1.p1  ORF type:complete len:169 (+),score=36.50 gnl/TRDRNA2_/TRDRNA2_192014_c0_seq1:53-559(+)